MDNKSLKRRAISGTLWNVFNQFGSKFITLITTIVLARLLGPKEYGLIAITMVFITISNIFVDSGFGKSLIQKKCIDEIDKSSVFFFNLFASFVVYAVFYISAPWIADFYQQPQLNLLLRVMGINVIILAFRQIHDVNLSRALSFRKKFHANLIAIALSGITGIIMAILQFGVWSLVLQSIVLNLTNTVIYWWINSWRPSFVLNIYKLRSLFTFGSNLILSAFLKTAVENLYDLLIGKIFSASDLGLYNRGRRFMEIIILSIISSVQSTTFPLYSKLQDDPVLLKTTFEKTIKLVFFIVVPAMVGAIIVAKPMIIVLLTDKWTGAVLYFQLFCVLGILMPFTGPSMHIFLAKGRSDTALKLGFARYSIELSFLAIAYRYGISAIIIGRIASKLLEQFINGYFLNKQIEIGFIHQVRLVLPYVASSLVMAALMLLVNVFLKNYLYLCVLQTIIGFMAYCSISYFFRFEPMVMLQSYLLEKFDASK